jgi:hypothetical protein
MQQLQTHGSWGDRRKKATTARGVASGDIPLTRQTRRDIMSSETGFNIGEGEVEGFGTRFDVARSRKAGNKAQKIKEAYPGADVQFTPDPSNPDRSTILVKMPGQADYVEFDDQQATTMMDAADVLGGFANEGMAASILAAIATRNFGLVPRMIAQFGAASGGHIAGAAVESGRGYDVDIAQAAKEAPVVGGAAALMEPLATGAGKLFNAARGKGLVTLSPEAQQAQRFAREHRLPELGLGELSPMAGRIMNQASKTSARAERAMIEPLAKLRDDLSKIAGRPNLNVLADDSLEGVVQSYENELMRMVRGGMEVPKNALHKMGKAVVGARQEYIAASQGVYKKLDGKAIELAGDGVSFNISSAKQAAQDALEGIRTRTDAGDIVPAHAKLDASVVAELEKIASLPDEIMIGEGSTAYEVVKALRTSFHDLKAPPAGTQQATHSNVEAGNVYRALTDSLKNPVGEASPEFRRAWTRSNKYWARRQDNLSLVEFVDAARNASDPEKFALNSSMELNSKFVRVFKRMRPDEFGEFRAGWRGRMLNNPGKIATTIQEMNANSPATLRHLMTEQEQVAFLKYAKAHKSLKSGPIQKALEQQTDLGTRAAHIMQGSMSNPRELLSLVKSQGGWDSDFGQSMVYGLIQNLITRSTRSVKGVEHVNPAVFETLYKELQKSGLIDMLPTTMANQFKDARRYLSFFKGGSDVGASMQAGEAASGIANLAHPQTWFEPSRMAGVIESALVIPKNALMARLIGGKWGRRIVSGAGKPAPKNVSIKAIADGLAATVAAIGISEE